MKKKLVVGILAHVDAGKTTLSESLLYLSGKIKKAGRVDKGTAYLDTNEMEKERGITIFSKQALFEANQIQITLLDTPGHTDFSAEMERTLQVLDYAILVVSGTDGVQGHTQTLWDLLKQYEIPVFLFVNKMDRPGAERQGLLKEIGERLDERCIEFPLEKTQLFYEELALCDEALMESYLQSGSIAKETVREAVFRRRVFPCFFGSALRMEGVEALLQGIGEYAQLPAYSGTFGARVFKITRDAQGNRLTHMKITGGCLKVKDVLQYSGREEKVDQIRLYSGEKFTAVSEAEGGTVCAVTGLQQTKAGDGLGVERNAELPTLEAVLSYKILFPEQENPRTILSKLRLLEEEEPALQVIWNETLQEIQVKIMGEVQIEILQSIFQERFGIAVEFGEGEIIYKETIADMVEGVGHFEPLRHYAEVHLLLEPLPRGSGMQFFLECSEEILAKNWQRLVLTHLKEKLHKGVLTGAEITDMRITLVSGRAHNKHTEGGDFREATYRAVRQALKEATSLLLEPFYRFHLEVPEAMVGRAMTDIERMKGTSSLLRTENGMSVLSGSAPVFSMRNYQKEVISYTKGFGRISYTLKGYDLCHNQEEVSARIAYDSERDLENPADSVFCMQGTGFLVKWNEVKKYMHLESCLPKKQTLPQEIPQMYGKEAKGISLEEIERILQKTFYANQGKKTVWRREKTIRNYADEGPFRHFSERKETNKEYLLVDGYNVIYAWPELKALAAENMDAAKTQLLDVLSNYQGILQCEILVVFDAYRVQGHREEVIDYFNIRMVYTKEAQPADQYIEKFAYDNKKKYKITVATSDALQQMIVRGSGSLLLSARELKLEIEAAMERVRRTVEQLNMISENRVMDALSAESKEILEKIQQEE